MTLLAAIRTDVGLELVFARPPAETVRVLASSATDIDRWTEVGTVPAGAAAHVLTGVNLPGGTPVRCMYGIGADSLSGNIVFITDPDLVLIRPGEGAPHGRTGSPGQPRSSPILGCWSCGCLRSVSLPTRARTAPCGVSQLQPYLAARARTTRSAAGSGSIQTRKSGWPTPTTPRLNLGPAMFHFALGGLPGLRAFAGAADGSLREPTDRPVDETRPGLDSDDEVAVGDDTDPDGSAASAEGTETSDEPGATQDRDLTEWERRHVRRRLEAAVHTDMPNLPAVHRLAIISLVLCAVQVGAWDGPLGDQGWIRVVSEALENLDRDDIPERMSSRAASWAAIAMYLVHEYRPTTGRSAEALLYEKAAAAVSHLLPDVDTQLVADLAAPFTNENGYAVDPDAVMYVIGMVVQGDPLAEAIDILETNRPAWRAHKHNDKLLHVDGEFRATFPPAAESLEAVPGTAAAAVWATGLTAGWTIAIRHDGTLIRVEKNPQGQVTWWHYSLGNFTSPTGIARDPELANRVRIRYGPLREPFPAAIQTLAAVGMDPSANPPSGCPSVTR